MNVFDQFLSKCVSDCINAVGSRAMTMDEIQDEIVLFSCALRDKGIRVDPVELAPDFETGKYSIPLKRLAQSLEAATEEVWRLRDLAEHAEHLAEVQAAEKRGF